ncbi:hypothetical protein ID852_12345 [Xenorhabdus sp. 42]|uniref:hypothetical protein n=1 Tax=Xenorhabdus szentirmaii TaxID=290112 RepID=UPI00198AF018|nr:MULTISPECIES: hypothetical protein [unclassified Xenorhabdus]MBD2794205.1 hypothetical protein [Xenorhabdus sp. CUL]MBD2821469.1 hypothetical protein [Xenorhabdus sp. 42]
MGNSVIGNNVVGNGTVGNDIAGNGVIGNCVAGIMAKIALVGNGGNWLLIKDVYYIHDLL